MLQTLSDKLLTLFSTLTGTGKPFVSVYDYITLDNTGYPYACFEIDNIDAEISDTCNNLRTYSFRLLMFQEVTETGGRKEAKEILTKAIDDVISICDGNYTLDGLVNMVKPVGGKIVAVNTNNGKALVCDMIINISVIEFIN